MSAATAVGFGYMSGLRRLQRPIGQSDSAIALSRMQENIQNRLLTTYSIAGWTEQVLRQLDELRLEAMHEGWDGYGARAVEPLSCLQARFFINALSTTAPAPEVSAGSDGEISLDWIFGVRKALTVSIGPTGRCTFAWMNGLSTYRGTDWLEDEIPPSISLALYELSRFARSH